MDKLEAPWLKSRHCLMAAEALGIEHIRFVGGAVRNSLMGLPVCDIDAATDYLPEKAMKLLKAKGFNVIPTGIEHGTVTAILDGEVIEVTTLRRDVETDGRHAVVAFTNEWQVDAERRDFTINAIYASIDGTLFDPCAGIADIDEGRIRFIGSAEERIQEDALRILRLFRFQAHYGRVPLEQDALSAVKKMVALIDGLSVERIAGELNKLILATNPGAVLKIMQEAGVLTRCMHETPIDLQALNALLEIESSYKVPIKARRRLLALTGYHASSVLKSWNCSNKAQKHALLCEELMAGLGRGSLTVLEWQKLIYRYNHDVVIDCYFMSNTGEHDEAAFEALRDWDIPIFPVTGADMLRLGYEPGPELGKLLKGLERQWLKEDFEPLQEMLLERLPKITPN